MTNKVKNIHIFGGGTIKHISNHLAVSAPAYGHTAKELQKLVEYRFEAVKTFLWLTKMVSPDSLLETNSDISEKIKELKSDFNTKIIFFNCAMVDWKPFEVVTKQFSKTIQTILHFGKYTERLKSHDT